MPVNPGPTRFTHQLRDQALHLAFGAIAGMLCSSYPTAMACAALYGAVREGEQWHTLNTPSVWDSALDWSFCVLGAVAGQIIRTHI